MGLKNKLKGYASGKIIDKKYIGDKVNNVVNKIIEKCDNVNGVKNTDYYISNVTSANYLVIKSRSHSVGGMLGFDNEVDKKDKLGRFEVYDRNNILKYKSDAKIGLTNRDVLNLYDSDNKKIGYVKEWLVSVGFLFVEKNVKKCTMQYNDTVCEFKKYVEFGELHFETLNGDIHIASRNGKDFIIKNSNGIIAELHKVSVKLQNGYVDKYVLEYNDSQYEEIAVLTAIAIDTINVE